MKKVFFAILTIVIFSSCGSKTLPAEESEDSTSISIDTVAVETEMEEAENLDPLVGVWECDYSGDRYYFYSSGIGKFVVATTEATFDWTRTGKAVNIQFTGESAAFGKQALIFDEETETIYEQSQSMGTLSYKKIAKA